ELAGAIFGIRGELIQALNAVERDADNGRAGGRELLLIHRERVRLHVAALRIRRRVEVHDDRPLLQRFLERELEFLPGQRGLRGEIGCAVAVLQGGQGGQADRGRNETSQ